MYLENPSCTPTMGGEAATTRARRGDPLVPHPFRSSQPRCWRPMKVHWSTEEDAEAQEEAVTPKVTWSIG